MAGQRHDVSSCCLEEVEEVFSGHFALIRATEVGESLLCRWVAAGSFDVVVRRVARREHA